MCACMRPCVSGWAPFVSYIYFNFSQYKDEAVQVVLVYIHRLYIMINEKRTARRYVPFVIDIVLFWCNVKSLSLSYSCSHMIHLLSLSHSFSHPVHTVFISHFYHDKPLSPWLINRNWFVQKQVRMS